MFSVKYEGDRAVALHLEGFTTRVHDGLLALMQRLAPKLAAAIQGAEPTRTGKLRAETTSRVYDNKNSVRAVAGPRTQSKNEAVKAVALNYGASRQFMVASYERRGGTVRSYSRRANIAPQRFLQRGLGVVSPQFFSEAQQVITEAENAGSQ